jgi:hypothetical protein
MTPEVPNQTSLELLIYQISEVKSLMRELGLKFDKFQEDIDKRVSALEIWQSAQNQKGFNNGGVDTQKIVLGALSVASAAIAVVLGLIQAGVFK